MFIILLLVTFTIALFVSFVVVRLFQKSINTTIPRSVSSQIENMVCEDTIPGDEIKKSQSGKEWLFIMSFKTNLTVSL